MTEKELDNEIQASLKRIENSLPAIMPRLSEDMIRDNLMSDEFLDFVKVNMLRSSR